MCIIAYAPKGQQIQEKTIRIMFEGNPHGAGIMWKPTDNSQVEIRKGFMKVEDLLKAYSKIPVECEKAIHCRIATAGKVSVGCCHPFPVRAKTSAMKQERDSAYMALMHNGVIGFCNPVQGMKADYSDTMVFASQILYPLQKMIDTAAIQLLIENSSSSRLLIFRKDAETLILGNWKYEDGIYYSNDNYKERTYAYGYTSSYWKDYTYDKKECRWVHNSTIKQNSTNDTAKANSTTTSNDAKTETKPTQTKLLEEPKKEEDSSFQLEGTDEIFIDEEENYYAQRRNEDWYGSIMLELPETMHTATAEEVVDDLEYLLSPNYDVYFTSYEIMGAEDSDTKFLYADYNGYLPMGIGYIGDYLVIDHANDCY